MVLNRDQYFDRLRQRIGDDSSDEAIAFLEDFTDTYDDFESRLTNNGEDWEKKAREIDEAWKRRYRNRFFNGDGGTRDSGGIVTPDETEVYDPEDVSIDSLFEEE